jgi:hypothetical protein
MHRALTWLNIGYGPWQGCGFMNQLEEMAMDTIAALGPSDAIVMLFWPWICQDQDWTLLEETDEAARRRWLSSLSSSRLFCRNVPKASTNRWMSIIVALKYHYKGNHERLFILTMICIMASWELPSLGIRDATAHIRPPLTDAPLSSGAASSSSGAVGDALAPPPLSAAAALKQAKAEKDAVYRASKNTLHVVTKYVSDYNTVQGSNLLRVFMTPLQQEHSDWKKNHVSPAASVAYYVDASACGTWAATLRATIALLVNVQGLASCGFNVDVQLARKRPHDEAILRHEDALAEEALRLVCNLLSERCSSMMLHVDAYPLALAALLDDDAEVRSSAMAKFRTVWEAYARARTMALPSLAKHVQRSPMATRPMEDFARLGRFYG